MLHRDEEAPEFVKKLQHLSKVDVFRDLDKQEVKEIARYSGAFR